MPQKNKIVLAIIADTHINSTTALCPPVVQLDDGGEYRSSRLQRWLYGSFQEYVSEVKHQAQGAEVVTVLNGDIVEHDTKKRSFQIITPNRATVTSMAVDVLEPLADISDRLYFVRGTAAHVGKSASYEETLAKDFTNTVPALNGASSHWQLRRIFGGVRFDIAHHARMSGIYRNRANWINQKAADTEGEYWRMNMKPPQVLVRSDQHRYSTSGDNYSVAGFTTPCFQLHTEYIYKINGENSTPDIGGLIFIMEDDKWTIQRVCFTIPRAVWVDG